MQSLRSARQLSRLVLAWLLLAMGAAVASPLLQPRAMALVCTAGGTSLVRVDADAAGAEDAMVQAGHALDCPLCLHFSAPPPQVAAPAAPVPFGAAALPPAGHAPHALRAAAPPLPARGPPASS